MKFLNIIEVLKNANKDEISLARLLILINILTKEGKNPIKGITKLVKLDFFLRYPNFLKKALSIKSSEIKYDQSVFEYENIESHMIRFLYGPWDDKYRVYLNTLYSKNLINIYKEQNSIKINLSEKGIVQSNQLIKDKNFSLIVLRSKLLKKNFNKSGNWLKNFIYANFPEIKNMEYGEVINK